jgi:hypothetical protein
VSTILLNQAEPASRRRRAENQPPSGISVVNSAPESMPPAIDPRFRPAQDFSRLLTLPLTTVTQATPPTINCPPGDDFLPERACPSALLARAKTDVGARPPRDFQIVAVSAQIVELPTVFVSMRMMMPGARRWRVVEIVVVLATGDDRLTDCDQVIRIPRQLPLPVRELLTSLPDYRVPCLSSVLRQQDHPS